MKYIVLRKRPRTHGDPFLEMVSSGGGGADFEFPFEVASEELEDSEIGERRQDPDVEDVVMSIPFTLIEPVEVAGAEDDEAVAWGIDAVGASSSSQSGAGVKVAVLDTGIDGSHPAFAGVQLDEMDFTSDEQGVAGSAPDDDGHGTHCAGTIFGRDVDGTSIGVAPGVTEVLIGKVLGEKTGSTEAVHNAIEWALKNKADVISMSLGIDFPGLVTKLTELGYPEDIAASRALEGYRSNIRLFDRLAALIAARVSRGRGAVIIAASGNESRRDEDPKFTVGTSPPAAADGFTAVGAVARTGNSNAPFAIASFSNTGCLLSAPGVSIQSAKLGGGLTQMSGTSMATPHAAGVAALWTHKLFPDDRPPGWARDVQRNLESNARKDPGLSRNDVGLGIVQAPRP